MENSKQSGMAKGWDGGGDGEEREREEERLLGIEYTFENASWENLA